MIVRRFALAAMMIWLAAGLAGPAYAAPLQAADVEEWADRTFGEALAQHQFSGLVISVVQDDQVVFSRGYGFADAAKRTPVDPAVTRFRVGSITKTFTATAIAQLLQSGAIASLDDPASKYLKRAKLSSPVTIRQLLTHTAGFDSSVFGLGTGKPVSLPLSAADVASFEQPVIRPLGDLAVYSNYGIALLGQIVEDVTGLPAHQYFEERIFKPLGMTNSTLNVSTSPSANLAVPYAYLPNGDAQEVKFIGVHPFYAPAGAIEATAADMTRYMIANLQQGRDGSAAVLSPEGYAQLHGRLVGNHDAVSGFAMSFLTIDWNGVQLVGHGGDWPGFHSILFFAPQERAGFFISCLCEGPQVDLLESLSGSERLKPVEGQTVGSPVTNVGIGVSFMSRFWGARKVAGTGATGDLATFEGEYWHEYRNHGTVEQLLDLFSGPSATMVVRRDGDRHLNVNGVGGYEQVSPGVFWNAKADPTLSGQFWDSSTWAFSLDAAGKPTHASPTFAIDPFVKVGAMGNPQFALQIALIAAVLSFTGLLALFWPATHASDWVGKGLAVLVPLSVIGVVFSLLARYPEGEGVVGVLLRGETARFELVVLFANLIALSALVMTVLAVRSWRSSYWGYGKRGIARRVHFALLSLAAIGLATVLGFMNALGVQLP